MCSPHITVGCCFITPFYIIIVFNLWVSIERVVFLSSSPLGTLPSAQGEGYTRGVTKPQFERLLHFFSLKVTPDERKVRTVGLNHKCLPGWLVFSLSHNTNSIVVYTCFAVIFHMLTNSKSTPPSQLRCRLNTQFCVLNLQSYPSVWATTTESFYHKQCMHPESVS